MVLERRPVKSENVLLTLSRLPTRLDYLETHNLPGTNHVVRFTKIDWFCPDDRSGQIHQKQAIDLGQVSWSGSPDQTDFIQINSPVSEWIDVEK
jgi:hypothetical protein